ncbi:MAG TPA: hypothetical protein PLG87_00935 [Treponemataceae bacterium]|jgi:hypothetical protein|nr:hypothetical protein [Treponemataceae bacterium]
MCNPKQISKIDFSAAGKNCKVLLGDINNDGRMEMIMVQADSGIDDRYTPHQVVCITAFDLEGNMLWQSGKPVLEPGKFGSDFPAQVHDIDGDGNLEVLCVMNKKFRIFDGFSGTIKKEFELPDEYAHDCIIPANLCGNTGARDIILKNRYSDMWALDKDFNLLWKHTGNIGHFPYVYDIDGDGMDEVMAGYDMLDQDGSVLWSCKDLDDHADCIWVGDVNEDGKVEIAVGGSVTVLYDTKGNEIWRYADSIESQHIALGKFRDDLRGLQMAGLDRIVRGDGYKGQWDGRDGMFLVDSAGKGIWKEDRKTKGWLTIVDTYRNWNGEGKDYILAYRRGGGVNPALYDGFMNPVVVFPVDGYLVHGDLFGRGIEDAVVYTEDAAYIFSGTPASMTPCGKKINQPKRLSMSTLYPGGEY